MASAGVGICLGENRARRRGDAEAWALILCVSAGVTTSCTGRCPSVAAHGIGRCGNGLGGESPAETLRRGDMSKNSASRRLGVRIHLINREMPLGCRPWHRPLWESAWGRIARGDAETRRGGQELCASASLRAEQPHAPGDAPRWLHMASAGVGICLGENRPLRRGDAEAWALILCASASLRAEQPHAPGDPKSPRKQGEPSRSTTLRITAGCVPTRRRSGWA